MPMELSKLVAEIDPQTTSLFFGSGSSIPSGVPSVGDVIGRLSNKFKYDNGEYSLREISAFIEADYDRRALIHELREMMMGVKPTGGLKNLPLLSWRSLYTTNYDDLIEQCYRAKEVDLSVYSSNFDFRERRGMDAIKLFKLHGTIEKDISDGYQHDRIIITDADYDYTNDFRQHLYSRLEGDLADGHFIIIGYSLGDEHIRQIINLAAERREKSGGAAKIVIFLYNKDENRAKLLENRGHSVCFGGIDEFIFSLSEKIDRKAPINAQESVLQTQPILNPITVDIDHALTIKENAASIFNGWPATYSDISAGYTFERIIAAEMQSALRLEESLCVTLLGPSGVGKTTACRQLLLKLKSDSPNVWEHSGDFSVPVNEWVAIAGALEERNEVGYLFVDDAHFHLHTINPILDSLVSERKFSLKIILCSSKNLWYSRVKSPAFFKYGKEFSLGKLYGQEIERLLSLVDNVPAIRALVEENFTGFSKNERRRRLENRCESDTFVCLKNIFASEKYDDIILREYANLSEGLQEIYKIVSAMESSGIRVHRQLVMRILGISPTAISGVLSNLDEIVMEYTINQREGIYGWKGRHSVIVNIITRYKFSEIDDLVALFEKVIDNISATYDIEIRTIKELCNFDSGIPKIPSKSTQNRLLRKLMSTAPAERVPRHRLIRNLVEMGDFEKAETEIRIFEKDFGRDGPISRYRINLLTERAERAQGIMHEDRIAILNEARSLSKTSISRYPNNKHILAAYCEVGVAIFQKTGDFSAYDDAIGELKKAEERIGDPEISKLIAGYQQRLTAHMSAK